MIKRSIEKKIVEATEHYPIVLVSGPRQIGKSTLLFNSFLDRGYEYVSFDDALDLAFAKSDPRSFLEQHKAPLIIDEVQKVPELFPELERIVNESRLKQGNKKSSGLYILSGSQREELLKNSKESLAGRVAIIDMSNLSLSEIYNRENKPFFVDVDTLFSRAKDYEIDEQKALKHIVRGSFPLLYDDKKTDTHLFYSSYLTTYLEKDLKEIIKITEEIKFINFLQILASNTGEELVYDNYPKQVEVSSNTIKLWISSLIKTGIIFLVNPYNEESIVKRVVKRPKMYFFDTGLAAYLCGIDSEETLKKSFLKGRFFETFIFNEIRKSYINNGEMQPLYYYRDNQQEEIDFILLRKGKISCIEIKAGQAPSFSFTKAFKVVKESKYEKGKNAIICTAKKISMLNEETLILPISVI